MTYRNKSILKAAKYAPHCMSCMNHNDGTVVAAHSNQQRDGKGMGHKADDYRVAYLCQTCHHLIDQGAGYDKQTRIDIWEAAHRKTVGWLFDSGILLVNLKGQE